MNRHIMKRIIFLSVALMAMLPIAAQQTRRLTAEKHNDYGIVYTLPKTGLKIKVSACKTVTQAGPYALYAKKYIGTDKVITDDSQTWSITDVSVSSYGIADREKEYNMQLKPGALTWVTVAEDGMLLSINAPATVSDDVTGERTKSPDKGIDPRAYLEFVGEDFLASQSTAKQAQMLAESLMEVRDAKLSLTRGTADNMPTDGKQLELMLSSLARQEAAMTAAFTGQSYTEYAENTYTYLPGEEGTEILMRISDFDGFTEADDYAGEPLSISIKVKERPELPVDEKGREKGLPRDAVVYTVPGIATVSLTYMGRKIYEQDFEMGQYGLSYGLQPSLFSDKKSPSYARFNPATGALEEIGAVSELSREEE